MIEAKELRIFNLVLDEDGEIVPVVSILTVPFTNLPMPIDYPCIFHTGSLYSSCDRLRGIILTTEWLERFDFKQYGSYWDIKTGWYKSHYLDITQKQTKLRLKPTKKGRLYVVSPANGSIILDHVHQLQNLYFALTQKELELKPITDNAKQP